MMNVTQADKWGGHRLTMALAVLTAALTPAYVIRWHIGFYPTTLLEAAILVTLGAFLLESWRAGTTLAWRSALTLPTVLFLLSGAISVVTAPSRVAALGVFRAYLVEPVLFAMVVVTIVRAPARAYLLVAGLCAAGTVLAVANSAVVLRAIVNHTFKVAGAPPVAIYTAGNAIALFLVPLIGVAGSLALHGRGRLIRVASVVFLAIAVPAAIITFSRGGWLALAAVAIGLALSHRRRVWLLGSLVVVGAGLTTIPLISQRIALQLQYESDETFSGRFGVWSASLNMLVHRPLFGAGLSGFAQRMGPDWATKHQFVVIYPHNLILNFWSETGLLGLFAFSWVFIVICIAAWQGWRRGTAEWRPIHLGVLMALTAVFVHGLVDVPYFKNDLSLEFWGVVALSWAGRRWGVVEVPTGVNRLAKPATALGAPVSVAPGSSTSARSLASRVRRWSG